jgi:hypothetical protein
VFTFHAQKCHRQAGTLALGLGLGNQRAAKTAGKFPGSEWFLVGGFHILVSMIYDIYIYINIYGEFHGLWGLEHHIYDFPYIGNFIIPTDEPIFFQRGRYTTNQV